ncbi:MAG: glycerol-3-phosphate cytidylyltransferase [Candidatus Cloacimonetes bacterium]|nr:glycerol-3-phosphate cytidylyltransferase [Candidatus Cloacimonadota bacterium]
MIRVLTYGTYDLFHYGHLRILKRARELGDYLVVGVSTDEFNALKNKQCVYPYTERAQIVEALKCVDLVIPEENWEQKTDDVRRNNIDIFVMGDDWEGKFDFLRDYCKVVYLPRTPDISSTDIKSQIKQGK